jgi:hypothetical protein
MKALLVTFGSWLMGAAITSAGSWVMQALVSLGIGLVTYEGLSVTIESFKTGAVSALVGLPPEVVSMLSLMRVGTCISMVFSAFAIRMGIQGMTGAKFKRFVKT